MPLGPDRYSKSARLRIGIYSNQYPGLPGTNTVGGIGTYTRSLAAALVRLGHSVHVLTQSDAEAHFEIDGVNVHCIQQRYLPILERWVPGARDAWRVSAAARKLSQDYALDIFEFPNWEGCGRFFKLSPAPPMVVRCHTSFAEIVDIENEKKTHAVRYACNRERLACRNANALYVSTAAHRRHMAAELGVAEESISILPLGIPDVTSPLAPNARKPRPIRTPRTVVFLGRLEKRKGTLPLIRAIPEIVRRVPDFRLVFIGRDRPHAPGGITHSEYFASSFPAAFQKHVIFAGGLPDDEVEQWFADSAALVAPSLYESFGLIFIEAMRWSLPVIGARTGGIPEVVEDGVNGLLTASNSESEIAQAVVALLTNEDLRLRLAAAARETYERKFTDSLMATRTADFYRSILIQQQRSSGMEFAVRLRRQRRCSSASTL